jgi:NADPH2:quinone reductase
MTTMRAVWFERVGDAVDVLRYGDFDLAKPGSGEVLVEVQARVVQPADFMFTRGTYRIKPQFPQVAGFEGVGYVTALGLGVDPSLLGQRVAFRSPGAWATHALVRPERTFRVPEGISDEVACQFSLNPWTAWGLLHAANLSPGARVLATAGRSSVVNVLAALGRKREIDLIRIAREDRGVANVDPPRQSADSLSSLLEHEAFANGFDVVFDAVGGPDTLLLMQVVRPEGTLFSYGVLDDRPFSIRASTVLFRDLHWRGFGINGFLETLSLELRNHGATELWQLLHEQPELLPVAERAPLSRTVDAIRRLQSDDKLRRAGKLLLVNDPV